MNRIKDIKERRVKLKSHVAEKKALRNSSPENNHGSADVVVAYMGKTIFEKRK